MKGQRNLRTLLDLVDEDTNAFNELMASFRLSADSEEERAAKDAIVQRATKNAIDVPLSVMREALASMEVMTAMALSGNPNSVSDAGVGALCARSAVMGAYLNVQINTPGVTDGAWVTAVLQEGQDIVDRANALEAEILARTEAVMHKEVGE